METIDFIIFKISFWLVPPIFQKTFLATNANEKWSATATDICCSKHGSEPLAVAGGWNIESRTYQKLMIAISKTNLISKISVIQIEPHLRVGYGYPPATAGGSDFISRSARNGERFGS